MIVRLSCLLFIFSVLHRSSAKLPSYIKVCKRNDPKIDQCIINSIELLKPKLIKGIPELDVPPLEPMHFDEFVISRGGNFKAIGRNVVVRGASNYQITKLKSDISKLTFQIGLEIPYINIEADYDVDMKILSINLKGKGPLQSNNTDITAQAILKGHRLQKERKTYIKFDTLDLKIKWKNYNVKLENLFGGDKALGDAVNIALNANKKEMIELTRPTTEKMVSSILLKTANQICKHFTFDELFPPK